MNIGKVCNLKILLHIVTEHFIWGQNCIICTIEAIESKKIEGKHFKIYYKGIGKSLWITLCSLFPNCNINLLY